MSMKNSNDTIENRTRDLLACSAVVLKRVQSPFEEPAVYKLVRKIANGDY